MKLTWKNCKKELPDIGRNVLAYNKETDNIELGFRSSVDNHPHNWIDLSFSVDYWAYINIHEIYEEK